MSIRNIVVGALAYSILGALLGLGSTIYFATASWIWFAGALVGAMALSGIGWQIVSRELKGNLHLGTMGSLLRSLHLL